MFKVVFGSRKDFGHLDMVPCSPVARSRFISEVLLAAARTLCITEDTRAHVFLFLFGGRCKMMRLT